MTLINNKNVDRTPLAAKLKIIFSMSFFAMYPRWTTPSQYKKQFIVRESTENSIN